MYSLIDSSNTCVNIICLDDPKNYTPLPGFVLIQSSSAIIGHVWNGTTFNPPTSKTYTPEEIVEIQESKILEAFKYMETQLEIATVSVSISSQNTSCNFGCDKNTQENIIGINTALAVGIPIPNPTNWTPKGYPFPVPVTHTELVMIGGAILNKKNELYTVYFTHKANIMMTSDYDTIQAYNVTTGY